MNLKRMIVAGSVAMGLVVAGHGVAQAATVGEILNEIAGVVAEDRELQQGAKILLRVKQELDEKAKVLAERGRQLESRKAELGGYCRGTWPRQEYERRLAYCEPEVRSLNDRLEQWNRQSVEVRERYTKVQVAAQKMLRRHEELHARFQDLQGRLHGVKLFANTDCHLQPSLDAMHRCMQQVWDGAGRNDIVVPDPPARIR